MTQSLAPLCLLPPSLDMAWTGVAPPPRSHAIRRRGDGAIEIPQPLFWYDPPWHRLAIETADALAAAVAAIGITVSALHRDLATAPGESRFIDHPAPANAASATPTMPSPRLVPYRPERYGLSLLDFQGRGIIDLRLSVGRDETGAHAFSQAQIQRWEATVDATPVAGGSWVPAATFPPDVISLEHLGSKILQLRKLSPASAIFVSLGPFHAAEAIARILAPKDDAQQLPDGFVLRFDQAALSPLQLAQQTRRIVACLEAAGEAGLPLWIVPGKASADDAAKLIALGANGVAADHWCLPLVDELCRPIDATSAGYRASQRGVVISSAPEFAQLERYVNETLRPLIDRFAGLCRSIQPDPKQRLGSFDEQWAHSLGVRYLGG